MQLPGLAAVAVAQRVVEHVQRMHAHQHRLLGRDIAYHQGDMFGIGGGVDIDHHPPIAAPGRFEIGLDRARHQLVVAAAIGDQIGDGAELQSVMLREGDQFRAWRAMVPSSFMISQIMPEGLSPASRAISTVASVWPARTSTPPSRAHQREDVAPG